MIFNFTPDLKHLPQNCWDCSYLFYKWGACPYPNTLYIWSLMSLIPYGLIIFLGLRCLITRRVSHINLVLLLLTAYLVGDRILKNLIQSDRPLQACAKSYGLPSSHMTVLVGYSYYAVSYFKDWKMKLFLLILCILQGFARVQLKYHTTQQVLIGCVFGILYSSVYVKVSNWIYFRCRNYIKSFNKLRWIGIIDDYHAPNKLQ